MIGINDTIYLYDPDDKEYQARVKEIHYWVEGRKVMREMVVTANRKKFTIRNGEVTRDDWDWSERQIPAIRKGAVVEIENWGARVKCKVLGLTQGVSRFNHQYVFEGIAVTEPRGYSLGRMQGHHFTASTASVVKVISKGRGQRLLRGYFLSAKEMRALFDR